MLSVAQGPDYLVEVDGAVHRMSGGEAGLVRAPASAMVVAIPVRAGDEVAEGDVVAVVESMKLETALHAPTAGRVAEVLADVNTQVESGTKLVRIEPDPDQDSGGEPESGQPGRPERAGRRGRGGPRPGRDGGRRAGDAALAGARLRRRRERGRPAAAAAG